MGESIDLTKGRRIRHAAKGLVWRGRNRASGNVHLHCNLGRIGYSWGTSSSTARIVDDKSWGKGWSLVQMTNEDSSLSLMTHSQLFFLSFRP